METIKFPIPKGYVKDEENSTTEELVLKYVPEPLDVATLEGVIEHLGEKDEDVIDYRKMVSIGITSHIMRYTELVIIIKAVNKEANGGKIWIPDWDNTNEKKWWCWWKMGSGFGLSNAGYGHWDSFTNIGSRLCFISEALALSTAKKNPKRFDEFLTIK